MATLRTILSITFLCLTSLSFAQWQIPDSYLGTATDIEGNTYDFQSYLDDGKPVFILEIVQWDSTSWTNHEVGHVIDLYNQYGQGGSDDVAVFYVAGYGFGSEADLSGIDYSDEFGPGYEDVSFIENNPVPIIVAADNPSMQPENEYSWVSMLCPQGLAWIMNGTSEVEEMMEQAYTNCCSNLENYDPALLEGNYGYGPDCDPGSVNYDLANQTMNTLESCNIDVYINGVFEEQFEVTETIEGCASAQMIYENTAIQEGDVVTLAIADDNDQLSNDTISVQTQEVDTLSSHIKIEIQNPSSGYTYVYAEVGNGNDVYIDEETNWFSHVFAEPGCHTLGFNTNEDSVSTTEMLLIGSVDEFGNYTDTLIYEDLMQLSGASHSRTVFIDGDAVPQQTWGYVYEDINETQTFHPDLPRIQGVQVDHGNYTTFTDVNGYYNFENVEEWENTSIAYDENTWPVFTTPNSGSYDQNNFVHNFGLNSDAPVWEFNSNLNYGLPYICESGIHQTISVNNSGNQPTTGEVTFTHDPMLTPVSFNPEPASVNGNTVTFEIPELQYGGFFNISIDYEELPGDSLGQLVDANLELITFDDQGNVATTSTEVVSDTLFCSYDPNDIYGFPLGYGEQGYIAEDTPLKYRVRFQNTGNYTATNVVVVDTLPEELDWESFIPGSSSHEYSVTMDENSREITWTFNNIMLPDSSSDSSGSIGHFWYDIEMNELAEGDQITNKAYIYFDQNPAIITNTSLHTIGGDVSVMEYSSEIEMTLFPNPANDQVKVVGDFPENSIVELRDMQGRLLRQWKVDSPSMEVSVRNIPAGVYLVKVQDSNAVRKLLIAR